MYIAVCDDQASELEVIVSLLNVWQEEHGTALRYKTFQSAAELLDAAEKERFTLYLLDVMMPGMSGLDAAHEIRGFDTAADIVFLTSSPGFAYESYGVHALDYLLKPIGAELLFPILNRLFLRDSKPQDSLTLKCGPTLIRVPFSQLVYVEAVNKHLCFNMTDGDMYEVTGSLKDYEELLLSQPGFMRVHRSYIVNIMQIQKLSPTGITTFSGKDIPIPRRRYPQIQKDYMDMLFNRREE